MWYDDPIVQSILVLIQAERKNLGIEVGKTKDVGGIERSAMAQFIASLAHTAEFEGDWCHLQEQSFREEVLLYLARGVPVRPFTKQRSRAAV